MRASRRIVFALFAAACFALFESPCGDCAEATRPAGASTPTAKHAAPAKQRLREGTQIVDRVGTIRLSGQRYVFQSSTDGVELRLLENLALERVIRTQDELREDRPWTVSGIVAEYQGENFLLLTRAVAKSASSSTSATRSGRSPAP